MVSLSTSVLCSAVLANSYIAVIPKSGILDESDNTRIERDIRVAQDPHSSDALLDQQFQSAILAFLNMLWRCSQNSQLAEQEYVDLVCSQFSAIPEVIYRGMGQLADPLINLNPIDRPF